MADVWRAHGRYLVNWLLGFVDSPLGARTESCSFGPAAADVAIKCYHFLKPPSDCREAGILELVQKAHVFGISSVWLM